MTCKDGVRWCRKRLGLTQAELAKKLGLTDATISYWESGATEPTQENLKRLCALSGITIARFWSLGRACA